MEVEPFAKRVIQMSDDSSESGANAVRLALCREPTQEGRN